MRNCGPCSLPRSLIKSNQMLYKRKLLRFCFQVQEFLAASSPKWKRQLITLPLKWYGIKLTQKRSIHPLLCSEERENPHAESRLQDPTNNTRAPVPSEGARQSSPRRQHHDSSTRRMQKRSIMGRGRRRGPDKNLALNAMGVGGRSRGQRARARPLGQPARSAAQQ